MAETIAKAILHEIPDDLKELLSSSSDLLDIRNSLTPIARNELICRLTIVKKEETRKEHMIRFFGLAGW